MNGARHEALDLLRAASARWPELRLCQIIVNAMPVERGNDPFYVTDAELASYLRFHLEGPTL